MKISYDNTDVVYDFDEMRKEDEDPTYKAKEIHTGRFLQSLYIELLPDTEYDASEEVKDGIVLDFDKKGNLMGIEIYLLDMVMDEEALDKFDKAISKGVTVNINGD